MISSGAKKDLLVIGLCNALLVVSKSKDAEEDKNLTKLDNSSYKINKRIERRLDKLQQKLDKTQKQFYLDSGNPRELGVWVKSKLDSRLVKVLNELSKETSLESLANQILFTNFCDRDKPLHDSFKWLTETKQHDEIFELIDQTQVSRIVENVYHDALKSIAIIKG